MNRFKAKFIEDFWNQFNSCRSEEDYANLLAWIYFENQNAFVDLPVEATIAQVWKACPSAVNKFVEFGGASLAALLILTIKDELKEMTPEDINSLKDQLIISNKISVLK